MQVYPNQKLSHLAQQERKREAREREKEILFTRRIIIITIIIRQRNDKHKSASHGKTMQLEASKPHRQSFQYYMIIVCFNDVRAYATAVSCYRCVHLHSAFGGQWAINSFTHTHIPHATSSTFRLSQFVVYFSLATLLHTTSLRSILLWLADWRTERRRVQRWLAC